ncbi:sel1 repeat family protein [Luteimonas marina]|uniref:Sel1 repeat family protein n=1 Tax=Luteimonas marina TaxID=488485 RepID=A0A5C5UB27_9GAMM|nr:sel1 repeat family protein [Luteimonas marina]TWT23216.1 sel1 repeat family protein [Luteimonas marina]
MQDRKRRASAASFLRARRARRAAVRIPVTSAAAPRLRIAGLALIDCDARRRTIPYPGTFPTMHITRLIPSLLVALLLLLPAAAAPGADKTKRQDPTIDPFMVAAGFLDGHPDLLHRSRGLDAYAEKDHPKAIQAFRRAAYYGDKPSQAILGEMLWIGWGSDVDRALAWVWMSLAAERGYTSFVEKRELYWQQLDEHERARAEREGPGIRAEYADEVTEPRLAQVLQRELRKMSGSRLGSTSSPVQIVVPGVGTIDSTQYYHPRYWDPQQYRAWQDSIWTNLRTGRVHVGDVQQVRDASTPPDDGAQDSPEPGPRQPADGENPPR